MPEQRVPVVAVVGRPNVGKSSLVNRIAGRREAVTDDFPGVTRDRKVVRADWAGRDFDLVDTGGWMTAGRGLQAKVSEQAARGAAEADAVLLVVDATVGLTQEDEAAAAMLRRRDVPVVVVANKVDSAGQEPDAWEAAALGMGEVHPVSALHGRGTGDLLDALVAVLPETTVDPTAGDPSVRAEPPSSAAAMVVRGAVPVALPGAVGAADRPGLREEGVAIVGRPNVGKSTLFNMLVGEDRSVVHDEPGTTRDAIDTIVETGEGMLRFIDTAGLRRRSRQASGAEYYSLVRALAAIDRADVALLVIDAVAGVTHQDQRLAERVDAAGSPVVIVLNKWELLDAERRAEVTLDVEDRLSFLSYAPVLKVSALTGKGVHKLLPAIHDAVEAYHRRVPTAELNRVVAAAQSAHPAGHGARILYATQGTAEPPTFTLFTNRALPPTYVRYVERTIREKFDFGPTPLNVRVRRRGTSR